MNKIIYIALFLAALAVSNITIAYSKSEFKEFGKQQQANIENLNRYPKENDCIWGVQFDGKDSNLITDLPLEHLKAGLQVGDRVIAISGNQFADNFDSLFKELLITRGQSSVWKIVRNNEEKSLTINCPVSRADYYRVVSEIFSLIKKDKPKECLKKINKSKSNFILNNQFWLLHSQCTRRLLAKKELSKEQYAYELYMRNVSLINENFSRYKLYQNKNDIIPKVERLEDALLASISFLNKYNHEHYAQNLEERFARRLSELNIKGDEKGGTKLPNRSTPTAKPEPISTGTAFYISKDGHLATNYHVIDGCSSIRHGDEELEVAAKDTVNDIAILKSKKSVTKFAQISTSQPKLSDKVRVYGYPLTSLLGESLSVTSGEVSSLSGFKGDFSQFTISAPIQPGNSGGPIVNDKNEVVGIVVSTLDNIALANQRGFTSQNVNFGIRATLMLNILAAMNIDNSGENNLTDEDYQGITKLINCYE